MHVRQGRVRPGTKFDYVRNTVAHLSELGLRDRGLEELARRADAYNDSRRHPERSEGTPAPLPKALFGVNARFFCSARTTDVNGR